MKLLFDFFPVIAFFITLKLTEKSAQVAALASQWLSGLGLTIEADLLPIMLATLVVILATLLQIVWVKLRHGKVDNMLLVSGILVTVLGGLTLYLHDPAFIKWKPTLLYWVFSFSLLTAEIFWKKNLLKSMMGKEIQLPDAIWKRLNLIWVAFFIAMGFLNLYIAYNFSIDTWASFKLFGSLSLTVLFILAQGMWLQKHIQEE
jgi:intracellular septation protein